jgi:uncharacterized membrane protein
MESIEHIITIFFTQIALVVDIIGLMIIIWGFILSLIEFIKKEISKLNDKEKIINSQIIRCKLGTYLLLGLEFLIASDVISSVIHRTINELTYLIAIVVIRTVIAFFLGMEIESLKTNKA